MKISRRSLLAGISVLPLAGPVAGCAARATGAPLAANSGPRYYIANEGSDANDGLSLAAAVKSVEKLTSFFPGGTVPNNTTIVLKGGQYHRMANPDGLSWILNLKTDPSVTEATQPKIITHDGTDAWFSGDQLIPTGWSAASAGETNSTAVSLGVEKRFMGAGFHHLNFFCVDHFMLQPCSWHPDDMNTADGYPSSIHAWDAGEYGSDGMMHYPDGSVPSQPMQSDGSPPAAYDPAFEIQYKVVNVNGSDMLRVKIANRKIAEHYGAVSPVGAWVGIVTANVQVNYGLIISYNQAESYIEFEYNNTSGATPAGTNSGSRVAWNIRGCPFDLRKVGQYAYSADQTVAYAIFPVGSTTATRSVARQNRGVYLDLKCWKTVNVGSCRQTSWRRQPTTTPAWQINGSTDSTFDGVFVKQLLDPERNNAIQDRTGGDSMPSYRTKFTRLRIEENRNKRGIALSRAQGVLLDMQGAEIAECGRTCIYFDGSDSADASGLHLPNVVRNFVLALNASVHGNGVSVYPNARRTTFEKFFILGQAGYCCTFQSSAGFDRYDVLKNGMLSNYRAPGTNPVGRYPIETSNIYGYARQSYTEYSHLISIGQDIHFSSDGETGVGSNHSSVLSNIVTASVTGNRFPAPNGVLGTLAGVTMRDVFAYQDKYYGNGPADWSAFGATLDNCSINTADPWTGSPSVEHWKKLTRKADGTYEDVQYGPDNFGYVLPGYGSPIVLANFPVTFDRLWCRNGLQKGRQFATVVGVPPLSTISFPAGVTDNDLIFQDSVDKSRVMFLNNAAAGVYHFTVRVVCAKATGPTSRDVVVTFTVRPDA